MTLGLITFLACGDRPPSGGHEAHHDVATGPVAPVREITSPLAVTAAAPADLAPAATTGPLGGAEIEARILVITADGTSSGYNAIVKALDYLGTPYKVFNASTEDLTADKLATGTRGHYQAIVLDVGNLSVNGQSALSQIEWGTLAEYESMFQVRRLVLYGRPEATYGLVPYDGFDTTDKPLTLSCTPAGEQVFADLNCYEGVEVNYAWAYPADPVDAQTTPLLVGADGKVFAAVRQHLGGRESLVFTFAQGASLVHSLGLLHNAIRWVTRGLYLGERHVYLSSQIDDLFLGTILHGSGEYFTITAAHLRALYNWQEKVRTDPLTADLRLDWAANGAGLLEAESLVKEAIAIGSGFKWISHTYSHPYFDLTPPTNGETNWAGTYAAALPEFTKNDKFMRDMGLQPYSTVNIVTPHISGLDNPEVMRAAYDAGIRYLVTDTSRPGHDNPTPNAGMYNQYQPGILMIPRRPNNLFYHVSTPAEWVAAYNELYRAQWGHDLTYDEILDAESDVLVQFLLRGENDPWMFHQANARDYGGGRSLLSDLHDRVLEKYAAVSKLPIVSPTMDELGKRVAARMAYNASGASAVIGPGRTITIRATAAATVPVTGLCTPTAEIYGGQQISNVSMAASTAATFSLDDCNANGPIITDVPKPPMPGKGGGGGGCSVARGGSVSGTALPLALLGLAALAGLARTRRSTGARRQR